MLRGKVTVGSAPAIALWACSGIWWMCMVWAGAHSSVQPPTPFILVGDATQSIDLAATGNKSFSDLLDSDTGLSDTDKENVMYELKTDQYRKAVRNSAIRNGNIFNRKTRRSFIHAVPYDGVTKILVHFHDKIRHFLKFMGNYGVGRHGLPETETFFVSQENKLDNISSLEQASAADIGNAKQPIAVRSKYSNGSPPTSSSDSTSETSFRNNSLDCVKLYDRHTPSPKRMNHNITAERTAVFRYIEYPPKKSNQMCIYDVDGSNCLVNASKIHVCTHSQVGNILPSTNCSIYVSRCAANVSYTVKESGNVKIETKSDEARDSEQKSLNLTLNDVSEQISSDVMKRTLNYIGHLGRNLEQIETLERLKKEAKTRRNEIHHDHVGIHETSSLNQHGDDGSGEYKDSYSRYKTLGRITDFKKANCSGDLQHESQDSFRKSSVRELRGLYSPIVTSSWNVKENTIEGVSNLMNNKKNIKLMDKYWQPMWYNVR